ncbi:MAG: hypothetical protein KDJ35_05975 [Alphaproteobacteria bacterium]|nr:hypothetical protein [Alphaproteobacteria bacterium]
MLEKRVKFYLGGDPRKPQLGTYKDVVPTKEGCVVIINSGSGFSANNLDVRVPLVAEASGIKNVFDKHVSGTLELSPKEIKSLEAEHPYECTEDDEFPEVEEKDDAPFGRNVNGHAFDF